MGRFETSRVISSTSSAACFILRRRSIRYFTQQIFLKRLLLLFIQDSVTFLDARFEPRDGGCGRHALAMYRNGYQLQTIA